MTLWLDAHLSPRIARWITDRFQITAQALRELGLREAEDADIWTAARAAQVVFVTRMRISKNESADSDHLRM